MNEMVGRGVPFDYDRKRLGKACLLREGRINGKYKNNPSKNMELTKKVEGRRESILIHRM